MGTTIALRCAERPYDRTLSPPTRGPSCTPYGWRLTLSRHGVALQQRLTHPGPVAVSNSTPSVRGISMRIRLWAAPARRFAPPRKAGIS